MELTINTDNLKYLEDFFRDLSSLDQHKIFISSYRKAVKPLVKQAKINAPKGVTRILEKSIGTVEIPQRMSILVGPKLAGRYKGWYAHFTEEGTKERIKRRQSKRKGAKIRGNMAGASTGKVTATHWFQNAFNATRDEVDSIAEKVWYEEIDKYIMKLNKKLK